MRRLIGILACGVLVMGIGTTGLADDFAQYALTSASYSWDADMEAAVESEFGPVAVVADWVDLHASFTGRIGAFCDAVGLTEYGDSAWVYRNGAALYSSGRHYFVARHNGTVPAGWLVHDHIDNHTLDLGSWGDTRRILVRLPVNLEPVLTISPASGKYITTQAFDVTLILESQPVAIEAAVALLNGNDVTRFLSTHSTRGSLGVGGYTFRCPLGEAGFLGDGAHQFSVHMDLSDGSSVSNAVTWDVLFTAEP